jgi:hypothetical protein
MGSAVHKMKGEHLNNLGQQYLVKFLSRFSEVITSIVRMHENFHIIGKSKELNFSFFKLSIS